MGNPTMRGMIPLGQPGNEEYDKSVRAKTKGAKSEKASISAQIRRIRDGTTKNVDPVIMELISNPQASATQIQQLIKEAMSRELKDGDFIQLIKTCIAKHSALFGNKLTLDADIRIHTIADTVVEQLRKYKEEKIKEDGK